MQEIGGALKEERLRQNLSLEEVSELTAFSVAQIKALEEGNLDYFKDDISYVKFFVQNYCKVLRLDYNQYKSAFDQSMMTYTNMLTQKEMEALRKSNEDIRYKAKLLKGSQPKRKKRNIDFSVLSMLVIASIMVIGVFFILSKYVLPNILNGEPGHTTKPSVVIDEPEETTTLSSAVSETTPGLGPVKVAQISYNEFEISGFKSGDLIQIAIEFHHRTWIDVKLDGVSFTDPASKIYQPNEKIVYEFEARPGRVVTMNLGYYDTNIFMINGQIWTMSDSLAKSQSGQVVKLYLKGE